MYYEKKMNPRTYYINVFLRNWSFLLAFHNGCYDKLVIVSMYFAQKVLSINWAYGVL